MEDLTLPSIGGSLKKWVYCAPILPKALAYSPKLPKNIFKKGQCDTVQVSTRGQRATAGRRSALVCRPGVADLGSAAHCRRLDKADLPFFFKFFFPPALHFLRK
jgi:hypothetical protein